MEQHTESDTKSEPLLLMLIPTPPTPHLNFNNLQNIYTSQGKMKTRPSQPGHFQRDKSPPTKHTTTTLRRTTPVPGGQRGVGDRVVVNAGESYRIDHKGAHRWAWEGGRVGAVSSAQLDREQSRPDVRADNSKMENETPEVSVNPVTTTHALCAIMEPRRSRGLTDVAST